MTHHINLMKAGMLPGHGRLQLPAFVAVIALSLLGAALWMAYMGVQHQTLKAELAHWQQRLVRSEQALQQSRSVSSPLDDETTLRQENLDLLRAKTQRESIYRGLAGALEETAQGFSMPLAQLSDIDLDGLWLSRIELRNSQQHLGLVGFTRQPGLVPRYLSQLEGSVFQGITIQNLNIEQTPGDARLWRFTLADATLSETVLNKPEAVR